ncbi:MAG: hypothetical protein K2F87_00395, partial [Muribaculaceae bacterium]|nr:hypothetical protein [Muribaculaceae bacterium]
MNNMKEYDDFDDIVKEMSPSERIALSVEMSPCNFIAVEVMVRKLRQAGFSELDLKREWSLTPGGRYFVTRNDTAIFAFICGNSPMAEAGFHIIAAHSDSPGFKTKPDPEIYGDGGVVSLNVEKYGGTIMSTWFDRPLSMAARLMVRTDDPLRPETLLVDLQRPLAVIPNLAIHFNRQVNDGVKLSVQKDMKPVMGYMPREEFDVCQKRGGVVKCLMAEAANVDAADIIGMECLLYPCESTATGLGINEDLIVSPRLDDLSMAFAAIEALVMTADTATAATRVAAVFDNEETGSTTRQGAAAPTLRHIVARVTLGLDSGAQENRE